MALLVGPGRDPGARQAQSLPKSHKLSPLMPVKKPCLAVQPSEKPMISAVGGRGIIAAADFSQSLQSPNVP